MYFDMNLKHLKVFYYVAKNLSFTKAARAVRYAACCSHADRCAREALRHPLVNT